MLCSFGVPGGLGYAPCLRISEPDCLVSSFAPNTCLLPWRGRECLVRHPHTSPAVARGHRLVFCCHRQCILPISTLCCRSAVHFVKMAILSSRLLFICFCRYFRTAVLHFVPLHTRVWRDGLLVSFLGKLYKIDCLYEEGSSLGIRVRKSWRRE